MSSVISVENARILKRSGFPQSSQAYWRCELPNLTSISGLPISSKERGKLRWLLVRGKPEEPFAAAYTLEELQKILKSYMEGHHIKRGFPQIRKEDDHYVCSIDHSDMFVGLTEQDVFASAVLYMIRL